jgi:hypothetical protein
MRIPIVLERILSTEGEMACGWRHLWSRNFNSTRGSHAPPGRTGKQSTGECALRGAGNVPVGERDDWSNVIHPAPYLGPKGRGKNSMVRKGR